MQHVIDNLKQLRQMRMSTEAQQRQRSFLLSRLSGVATEPVSVWRVAMNHPLVFKPLAYVAAVLLLLISGSSYTMLAAGNSLPGNPFYPVKLQLEKLQVTLTADEVARTKMQIEFADRRLQELSQVTDTVASPVEKQEQVAKAVRHFNDSLQDVKSSFSKVSSADEQSGEQLVNIAQLVNDKTKVYEDTLVGYYPDLPVTVKSVLEKEVEDVKFQSLEVLVKKYEQYGNNISREALSHQLQDRLIVLGEGVSELDDSELQQTALDKLDALQQLLDMGDFSACLAGSKEYEQWLDEATAEPVIDGEVLGVSEEVSVDVSTTTISSTEVIQLDKKE